MKRYFRLAVMISVVLAMLTGCSGSNLSGNRESRSADYDSYQVDSNDSGGSYKAASGDQGFEAEEAESAEALQAEPGQQKLEASGDQPQADGQETETSQDGTTGAAADTKKEKKEEKLVYTCNLTIETTSYKETMEEIEKQIREFSGIIESQNEYDNDSGWYIDGHQKTSGTMECTIVVKVPAKDYQAFLKALDGKGKMTNKSMDVTNISRTYYDTQATIESLKIQEKRLMKMMDEAKTIDEMITVEKRLTEVQTQLNQYKTRLSTMDTEVAYSTVTMTIREVLEYKQAPEGKKTNTFIERLNNTLEESWSGFLSFMEGLLFLIIRLLPFAIVFGLVWFVTRPLRRRFAEHRRMKREERRRTANSGNESAGNDKKEKKGRFRFGKGKKENQADGTDEDTKEEPDSHKD